MSILGVQGSQGGGGSDFSGGSGVVSQEVWLGWVSQHSAGTDWAWCEWQGVRGSWAGLG